MINVCICGTPEIQFSHSTGDGSFTLKCEVHYDKSEASFSRIEMSKDNTIYFTYGGNDEISFKPIEGIDKLERDIHFIEAEKISSYAHIENEIAYRSPQVAGTYKCAAFITVGGNEIKKEDVIAIEYKPNDKPNDPFKAVEESKEGDSGANVLQFSIDRFDLKCELEWDISEASFSRIEMLKDSKIYFTYGENSQKSFKHIDGIKRLESELVYRKQGSTRHRELAHVQNQIKYWSKSTGGYYQCIGYYVINNREYYKQHKIFINSGARSAMSLVIENKGRNEQ
ncbi:unnamed protein product [Oppiella nova]|uniref:Uncharacterized protein n=1 Tax=Oppiella nova TaxID=334625 RepID=A0A7R9LIY4_9ACAR|nr:unnamed protein product [Oppiella nova]CAG2164059.1 unnamed protein product [Oppiella nova]